MAEYEYNWLPNITEQKIPDARIVLLQQCKSGDQTDLLPVHFLLPSLILLVINMYHLPNSSLSDGKYDFPSRILMHPNRKSKQETAIKSDKY